MPSRYEMNGWVHERAVRLQKKLKVIEQKIAKCNAWAQCQSVLLRKFFEMKKKYHVLLREKLQQKLKNEQRLCLTHTGPWGPGGPSFSICPNCFKVFSFSASEKEVAA